MPQGYPVMIQVEFPRGTRRQRRFAALAVPAHLDGIAGVGPCEHESSAQLGWVESRWTIAATSRSRAQSELDRIARQLARRVEHDLRFARHGLYRATTADVRADTADGVLRHSMVIR